MKKILLFAGMVVGLFSCVETVDTDGEVHSNIDADTVGLIENIDSSALLVEDEKINSNKFVWFDDYATIKTKSELIGAFGEGQLLHDTTWFAEGTVMMERSTLTDSLTGNYVRFLFKEKTDSVSFIEAPYYQYNRDYDVLGSNKTKTKNGLFAGMEITELYSWNEQKEIKFFGFGWDYEGGVMRSEGTKLGDSKVKLKLSLKQGSEEVDNSLYGDVELSTENPVVMDAPIIIDVMTLYYEE